jgi:hypothetical protein
MSQRLLVLLDIVAAPGFLDDDIAIFGRSVCDLMTGVAPKRGRVALDPQPLEVEICAPDGLSSQRGNSAETRLLVGFATVVALGNSPAAILLGDFAGLVVSISAGIVGIRHFRRLAANVDLLCQAPLGDVPAARPKRKLHRFKTVNGSHTRSGRRRSRKIECSLCGAQREIVRRDTSGE